MALNNKTKAEMAVKATFLNEIVKQLPEHEKVGDDSFAVYVNVGDEKRVLVVKATLTKNEVDSEKVDAEDKMNALLDEYTSKQTERADKERLAIEKKELKEQEKKRKADAKIVAKLAKKN